MAGLHEPVAIAPVALAVVSVAVCYLLAKKAGTAFFSCALIISTAISVSTLCITLAPAEPAARAAADAGIMLAGAVASVAAGGLLFAFRQAGDAGDG